MQSQIFEAVPPHIAQPHVQARLYEAGCELEQLADLFAAITDHLDGAYDARRASTSAANLARLGFEGIDAMLKRLVDAEGACASCWKGRLIIADKLASPD
jgi:hypothetical protein